jgi:hypothetical protein
MHGWCTNRRKDSFFETKPRLVRRNTLLLRDGADNSSASATSFSEIQSVTVVGKGYADDGLPSFGAQPSKILREKRRLMKGVIIERCWCDVDVHFDIRSVFSAG